MGLKAPGVDGIDGNLAAGQQVRGFAELIFHAGHDGGGIGDGGVGKDVEREGAGEPDQVLAAGDAAEVSARARFKASSVCSARFWRVVRSLRRLPPV